MEFRFEVEVKRSVDCTVRISALALLDTEEEAEDFGHRFYRIHGAAIQGMDAAYDEAEDDDE